MYTAASSKKYWRSRWLVSPVHMGDTLPTANGLHQIPHRANSCIEVGVATPDGSGVVRVAVAQLRELRVLDQQLRGALPKLRVHVVGHHLNAVEVRPLLGEHLLERLGPAVGVRRDARAALSMHLAAQLCPRDTLG